jgi:FkbM family methyltransferase
MKKLFLLWYRRLGWRGFSRLWKLLKPSDGLLVSRSKSGVKFLVNPFDYIDTHVILDGEYESEVWREASGLLPANGVVWDIGANMGVFALSLERARPDAKIIAFEPNVAMASRLFRNVVLNQSRVQICCLALSQRCGAASFFVMPGNSGMSTLIPWGEAGHYEKVIVPLVTGDSLIAGGLCVVPNLLKMDVEGAEEFVLRGMGGVLKCEDLTCILFEGGPDVIGGASPVSKLLAENGFAIRRLVRNEPTHHALENFLAVRPKVKS